MAELWRLGRYQGRVARDVIFSPERKPARGEQATMLRVTAVGFLNRRDPRFGRAAEYRRKNTSRDRTRPVAPLLGYSGALADPRERFGEGELQDALAADGGGYADDAWVCGGDVADAPGGSAERMRA